MTRINEPAEVIHKRRGGITSYALRALATWLLGLTIFVGLPLVAWGASDARAFWDNDARRAYVLLVIALNAYAAIRIPEVGKSRPDPVRIVGRQRWAVLILQVLSLAIVVVGPFADRRAIAPLGVPEMVRFVGVALYAAGFVIMHRAEATLGKQFSLQVAVQQDHELVTGGLYRHIRHPRYLGITMFSVGLALVFRSALALTIAVAIAAVLAWRVHDEEIMMEQEFGDRWRAYARRSWRVLPFVY